MAKTGGNGFMTSDKEVHGAGHLKHWSECVEETLLSVGIDAMDGLSIVGGAENGLFCWVCY